ncbi:peptidoglycan-binding protein [Kitasatospora sp. NPDC096147]|uniref:peptidoglycan-binding protein n=1 Tax=Kitasatospora sp. NPDC096147 TaxID=3364093 RepID=UPI00380E1041
MLIEFTEIEPDRDCGCGGCSARRLARLHAAPVAEGGHRSAHGARRAALLVAAVGSVLGGGVATAAPAPAPAPAGTEAGSTPQGEVAPLRGAAAETRSMRAVRTTTRAEIMARAQRWIDQQVPYSMSSYWSDGYRQDCSGFVSMAWGLGSSQTTWTLPDHATRIARTELQPGDILVYNNAADPAGGSHTVIFGGWADAARSKYLAYEQTRPATRKRTTPYAYWNNAASYVAYRYEGLDGPAPAPEPDAFPGTAKFGPGQRNEYVKRLGELLVQRGGARFYAEGPDPSWGEADRRATEAFQLAQGWRGSEADGYPGKATWDLLVQHRGKDIPPAVNQPAPPQPPTPAPAPDPGPAAAPPYPGASSFGPGQSNESVKLLGEQLVRKGFGRHYTEGPGPEWGEADRLNVADFQRAQGWSGSEADGYPGPHTWRLLFG